MSFAMTLADVEAHNRKVKLGKKPWIETAVRLLAEKREMEVKKRTTQLINANRILESLSPSPEPERAVRHDPLGKERGKEGHTGRILVSIESRRRRLIDPDNLTPKYFIDCLRYSGLIPGDRAEDIELKVFQTKVFTIEEQATIIEVTTP